MYLLTIIHWNIHTFAYISNIQRALRIKYLHKWKSLTTISPSLFFSIIKTEITINYYGKWWRHRRNLKIVLFVIISLINSIGINITWVVLRSFNVSKVTKRTGSCQNKMSRLTFKEGLQQFVWLFNFMESNPLCWLWY